MGIRAAVRRAFTAVGITAVLTPVLLVVAPTASAAPPGYQLQSVQVSVPAGGYLRQRVGCPSGTVPVNGGVSSATAARDDDTRLQGSAPKLLAGGADTGWEVALLNGAGSTRSYTVYAVCIPVPPGYQLTTASLRVPARSWATAMASCPAGKAQIGGGVNYHSNRDIAIVESSMVLTGKWSAAIRNAEGVGIDAVVWAICANPSAALTVSVNDVDAAVGQVVFGTPATSATVSCPDGLTAIGGGAYPHFENRNTRIMTSAPTPNASGWTVTLRNYEAFNIHHYWVLAYCVA